MGNIMATLPAGTSIVSLDGRFNVAGQGLSSSNVPTFRLFDRGTRILDVYRQNVTGSLWLRTYDGAGGWTFYDLHRIIPMYQWFEMAIQAKAAGASSSVSVTLNGTLLFSGTIPLITTTLSDAMVGAEHVRQVMDLYFDDVTIGLN
jgi:hypothetical protein